jgi:hypothetical protein
MSVPAAIELAWDSSSVDEACIGRDALAARVEATLGRRVFARRTDDPVGATLSGRTTPDPAGRGWIGVVEIRRSDAEPLRRELRLPTRDCRQLDDALVLVVALMIDASGSTPLASTNAGAHPTPRVTLGPDLAVAAGMLPGIATGIGLSAQADLPPFWPIGVWAHGWLPSNGLSQGSGGQMGAWTLGAALCPWTSAPGRWEVLACAGGSGGVVVSRGVGLDVQNSWMGPYAQAEVQAIVRVRIAAVFFARVGIGAAVPVVRHPFGYTQADGTTHEVFQTAQIVALGHLSIEIRLPH